jgi:hypothetical protein
VLEEMHNIPYDGHQEYQKTISTLKSQHFFREMKKYVDEHIDRCMECQKVKDDNRNPSILLQPFPILEWKWECFSMDFITKLPITVKKHDSIMVVVDKITKATHFILVKLTHKESNIAKIYMK